MNTTSQCCGCDESVGLLCAKHSKERDMYRRGEMSETKHTPGPLEVPPDSHTVQSCCLAYGGSSFSPPMKKALECHLAILKTRHPEMAAAEQLLSALKAVNSELESVARNCVRGNPHGYAVIVSSEARQIVKAAILAAERGPEGGQR